MSTVNHWIINLYNVNVFSISSSVKWLLEVTLKGILHVDEHINGLFTSKCTVKDLGES